MRQLTQFIRSLCPQLSLWHECCLPLQHADFPVVVCWSAKSGCTTVLKWFLAHNGLLEEATAYSGWIHDYRQHRLERASGYRRQCKKLFNDSRRDKYIIKVIRDPASRAVSSFLHVLRVSHDTEHWPVAIAVAHWKEVAGLSRQRGLSFRQFLQFVNAEQLKKSSLETHIRPQYDSNQDPRVHAYVRLENLTVDLELVEEHCELPHVNLGELSKSSHHNLPTATHAWPANVSEVAADYDTLKELGTPSAKDFLDPETQLLIQTTYWSDYEAYGHHYDGAPATSLRIPRAGVRRTGQDSAGRLRWAA